MSLDDLPKRVQYVMVDSGLVNGTNNNFSLDLSLKSSIHVENINQVIGLKVVEFYVTQVGGASNVAVASNIAKFIDIKCDDIPKIAKYWMNAMVKSLLEFHSKDILVVQVPMLFETNNGNHSNEEPIFSIQYP